MQRLLTRPAAAAELEAIDVPRDLVRPWSGGPSPVDERTYAYDKDMLVENLEQYDRVVARIANEPAAKTEATRLLGTIRYHVDIYLADVRRDRDAFDRERLDDEAAFPFEPVFLFLQMLQGTIAAETVALAQLGRPAPAMAAAPAITAAPTAIPAGMPPPTGLRPPPGMSAAAVEFRPGRASLSVASASFVPRPIAAVPPSMPAPAPLPAIGENEFLAAGPRVTVVPVKWWSSRGFPHHNAEMMVRIDGRDWAVVHVKWNDSTGPKTSNVMMLTFKDPSGASVYGGNINKSAAKESLVAEALKYVASAPAVPGPDVRMH